MIVMTLHNWFDGDVEKVIWEAHKDVREIVLKKGNEGSLSINKKDVIELAKEFNLLVFEEDSSL